MASCAISLALSLRVLGQRPRRRQRIRSARADGADAVVRLDHVAISGKQESAFGVGHHQQRFEVPQRAVLAPFLGQFHGRFAPDCRDVPAACPRIARKAKARRPCEPANPARILSLNRRRVLRARVLHHVLAHGDLAVGGDHHFIVPAHAQNRRAVYRRTFFSGCHLTIIRLGEGNQTSREWRRVAEPHACNPCGE